VTLALLDDPVDFDGWRRAARAFALADVKPEDVVWQVRDQADGGDLFADETTPAEPSPAPVPEAKAQFSVPRPFVDLASQVILHSAPERFSLLYRILWRLRQDRNLIDDASDVDIHTARAHAKSVARDIHKMHAFVRFKEVPLGEGEDSAYLAWFEPDHYILEAAAPFFVRRFTGMRWSILTPRRSAAWDGETLSFLPGAARSDVPDEDRLEAHWRTYYASIFNPARLKIDAMTREMPKKYWKNLPEAVMIPSLIKEAGQRADAMVAAPPTQPSRSALAVARRTTAPTLDTETQERPSTLEAARTAAANCQRCDLYRPATQTVFGVGSSVSGLMFVGEQPGDKEDIAGTPFVGPAGQMFDKALGEVAIDRDTVYVTNAVKHFKYEPRGKFRLHKKPDSGEIAVCRWWLDLEREFIAPKLIVALGASAAQSILDRPVTIGRERGRPVQLPDGATLWITVHPSYLLRVPDDARPAEYKRFVQDLLGAKAFLAAA
jgi:probable DNA metabolism protein